MKKLKYLSTWFLVLLFAVGSQAATLTIKTTVTDSRGDLVIGNAALSVATTGSPRDVRTIALGTAEETHTLAADVSGTAGWAVIVNHDATNYIEIGMATTVYVLKLKAGEVFSGRIPSATTALYLKANTGACDVTVAIWAN